jgi:hypothetical protein
VKRRIAQVLHLDSLRLTPQAAAAVLKFRSAYGAAPPSSTPESVLPVTTGSVVKLRIVDMFPQTTCFAQVDLHIAAIRWSQQHFISLHNILLVQAAQTFSSSKPKMLAKLIEPFSPQRQRPSLALQTLQVSYSSPGGVTRVLELKFEGTVQGCGSVQRWMNGFEAILKSLPRIGSPAHWRWAMSCMAATSRRGQTGVLRESELRIVLRCANALGSDEALEQARRSYDEDKERLGFPQWLDFAPAGDGKHRLVGAQEITGVLLPLCTITAEIVKIFNMHSVNHRMGPDAWMAFSRAEQLAHDSGSEDEATFLGSFGARCPMLYSRAEFESVAGGEEVHDRRMNLLQCALHVLSPRNDAVVPIWEANPSIAVPDEPLSHHWTACSHNTCTLPGLESWLSWFKSVECSDRCSDPCATDIVGDQFTGLSSADMYRRQLLQVRRVVASGCGTNCFTAPPQSSPPHTVLGHPTRRDRLLGQSSRQEGSCRDSVSRSGVFQPSTCAQIARICCKPDVCPCECVLKSSGHTFCTIETFERVAIAVSDCAFVTSALPVILSLEVTPSLEPKDCASRHRARCVLSCSA